MENTAAPLLESYFMETPQTASQTSHAQNTQPVASNNKTLAAIIGEMLWVMMQSPIHRELKIKDLEWLVMPALVLNQFKIYKDDQKKPTGLVLWAYLNEDGKKRLQTNGKLNPEDWGNGAQGDIDKGLIAKPGGELWLVELVAPFHTDENKHRDIILLDLLKTEFQGKEVRMTHINPKTQKKEVLTLGGKR